MVNFRSGWRPSPPDPRDRRYLAAPHVLAATPPALDLSDPAPSQTFAATLDQRDLGACGPHTEAENIVFDLGGKPTVPSRLYLYYNTRALMGTIGQDSGVDNRTMLKALARYGWCPESLWPYDTSRFREQPPQACYDAAAQSVPAIVYQSVPQDLAQMKACLFELRRPIIFGFTVYSSMLGEAAAVTGYVPDPIPLVDQVRGGHDVLIVGYDDAQQRFKFKNHWTTNGRPWGNHGYGTISYRYALNPNLAGDFWVVTAASKENTPMPDPIPTPVAVPAFWSRLVAIVEHLLKEFGPMAVPLIEGWVATLNLPPVVVAAIDALLEKYVGKQLALAVHESRTPADLHCSVL